MSSKVSGIGPQKSFFSGGRHKIDVIAHRGGAGEWPGETLFAFDEAEKLGVDVLEMDIRVTRDEHLVMMHNPTVRATTNGWLPVRCYKLADIQKLDAAYHWGAEIRKRKITVPTFEQVLQQFGHMRMNIEIKGWHPSRDRKIGEEFCRLVVQYGVTDRILVASHCPRSASRGRDFSLHHRGNSVCSQQQVGIGQLQARRRCYSDEQQSDRQQVGAYRQEASTKTSWLDRRRTEGDGPFD